MREHIQPFIAPEVKQVKMGVNSQESMVALVEDSNQQRVGAFPKEGPVPTPVRLKALLAWLDSYPSKAEAEYLVLGFHIPYEGRPEDPFYVQESEICFG